MNLGHTFGQRNVISPFKMNQINFSVDTELFGSRNTDIIFGQPVSLPAKFRDNEIGEFKKSQKLGEISLGFSPLTGHTMIPVHACSVHVKVGDCSALGTHPLGATMLYWIYGNLLGNI